MKPSLEQIPIARSRACHGADYLIQRKSDGQHRTITLPQIGGGTLPLNAELMPDGTHRINDVFLAGLDSKDRWTELQAMARHLPPGFELEHSALLATCHPSPVTEFLDQELARGGEGIVLKPWDQPFGIGWLKAKRSENFLVRVVAGPGDKQSVEVEIIPGAVIGQPETWNLKLGTSVRTRVALRGGKCDRIRPGSILKVTGFGLTARGLIREARPCNDTPTSWLVTY